jgi:hypothetical protein
MLLHSVVDAVPRLRNLARSPVKYYTHIPNFVEVMLGYKGGVRANILRTSVRMNDFFDSRTVRTQDERV